MGFHHHPLRGHQLDPVAATGTGLVVSYQLYRARVECYYYFSYSPAGRSLFERNSLASANLFADLLAVEGINYFPEIH